MLNLSKNQLDTITECVIISIIENIPAAYQDNLNLIKDAIQSQSCKASIRGVLKEEISQFQDHLVEQIKDNLLEFRV